MTLESCPECNSEVSSSATTCPQCGHPLMTRSNKSKAIAAILAILFTGAFGIHRFYLKQWIGILYLLFCWTGIPSLVSLIEGIVFLMSDQEKWDIKYNDGIASPPESGAVTVVLVLAGIFLFMYFIAIIGILAAIAIPSYNDYTARAQVTEAVNLVGGLKTCVAEGAQNEQWPELTDCGYSNNTNNVGKYVKSISCINCGTNKIPIVLIATFKNTGVSAQIGGETFAIGSRNGIEWTCGSATADGSLSDANGNAGATTIGNKLLPGACKN